MYESNHMCRVSPGSGVAFDGTTGMDINMVPGWGRSRDLHMVLSTGTDVTIDAQDLEHIL